MDWILPYWICFGLLGSTVSMEDEGIYKNGLNGINKVKVEYKLLSLIEKKHQSPYVQPGFKDFSVHSHALKMNMATSLLKHKHRVIFSPGYSQVTFSRCIKKQFIQYTPIQHWFEKYKWLSRICFCSYLKLIPAWRCVLI